MIKVKNADGVEGFLCSIYCQVSKHDKALKSRRLNSILLFHFIIQVTILPVVLLSLFRLLELNRTASSQLFIQGELSELDRARPTSLAGPF